MLLLFPTGDILLDTKDVGSMVMNLMVLQEDGSLREEPNTLSFWETMWGDTPMQSTFVLPVDDLQPFRVAMWQCTKTLCTEQTHVKRHRPWWQNAKLVVMPLVVTDNRGTPTTVYGFEARKHARLIVENATTWAPLFGLDADLIDLSSVSVPSLVNAHLGACVSIPVAGHHPSTTPFWSKYSSSAIRGCVRTVLPQDPDHARLRTVDYKACYLTCMRTMAQDIPVPCECDVFVPVHTRLDVWGLRSPHAHTRGMW